MGDMDDFETFMRMLSLSLNMTVKGFRKEGDSYVLPKGEYEALKQFSDTMTAAYKKYKKEMKAKQKNK